MAGLFRNLARAPRKSSVGGFLTSTPELIPLAVAVSFGLSYGIYAMGRVLGTDPHLRVRQGQGLEPEGAWTKRV
ncbi:hypothetical protein BC828DRAFT_393386 [Blastocladiella britannica]|nr:hypothetical protein BC828DRAFT_393386 [Blastocladiella britannica]